MIERKKTRQIKVGGVRIGGLAPVSIQSMAKVATSDVKRVVSQIKGMERAGCEIVRVAVRDIGDAESVKEIKKRIKIPLVCDIHFDHRLALRAIASGADKIRLNPGNIRKKDDIIAVIKAAKKARIPVRIGANSGSVREHVALQAGGRPGTVSSLVDSAMSYIEIFEKADFRDIIISLKASDVASTVEAYRKMSSLRDYPLHLGVTAAGVYDSGVVKSSIGTGALLVDGIGDTIRVSLTADPVEEIIVAKRILGSLGVRRFGPDIVSCPTCGRCRTDLIGIVKELDSAIRDTRYAIRSRPLTIAIMGCEVNGPGEAKDADMGIAAGKGSGVLFLKGKICRRVKEKDFVKELLKELKNI